MHPKHYKGKRIVSATTASIFTLEKGKAFKNGSATVSDESGKNYDWAECTPLLEMLNAIATVEDYQQIIEQYGCEFAATIWQEFGEHYPVETAITAVRLYCTSWEDFCCITDGYGVSIKLSEKLNQQFRDRLKQDKNLSDLVAHWYTTRGQEEVA